MKKLFFRQRFNWRIFLLRILVNAVALIVVAAVLPDVYFVHPSVIYALWLALFLGILNAILKPVLQLLTFSLIFVSYGIVLVAIDTLMLFLLDYFFPELFEVSSLFWALVGGAIMGILSSFLEDLVGIAPPILPEKYVDLRKAVIAGVTPSLEVSLAAAASASAEASTVAAASAKSEASAASPSTSQATIASKTEAAQVPPLSGEETAVPDTVVPLAAEVSEVSSGSPTQTITPESAASPKSESSASEDHPLTNQPESEA